MPSSWPGALRSIKTQSQQLSRWRLLKIYINSKRKSTIISWPFSGANNSWCRLEVNFLWEMSLTPINLIKWWRYLTENWTKKECRISPPRYWRITAKSLSSDLPWRYGWYLLKLVKGRKKLSTLLLSSIISGLMGCQFCRCFRWCKMETTRSDLPLIWSSTRRDHLSNLFSQEWKMDRNLMSCQQRPQSPRKCYWIKM